ncbi:MAG: FAD-binding protein, partial [Nocardioidaceae bacterium]|nr:FAD-binding protein [Nocardioidaceae bacterium]
MTRRPTNWAGNIAFKAQQVHSPTSIESLQGLVRVGRSIRPLGTGHSFNRIADTTGDHVSVHALPQVCSLDPVRSTVTVSAGMRYGELAGRLDAAGYALRGLGSLPHISVAGAIATGTHGSGNTVGNLASDVVALQLVTARGDLAEISLEDDGDSFCGAVLALGALGVVTRVTLRVVPAYEMRQWVYDDLPRAAVDSHLE